MCGCIDIGWIRSKLLYGKLTTIVEDAKANIGHRRPPADGEEGVWTLV